MQAALDSAGNAVGVKGEGPKDVLLLGHIDTFPGDLPVRHEKGRLFGRGVVDAKGALCVFAVAASQVPVPAGWRVTVVGAVEEENTTSRGARTFLDRQGRAPCCCVIGEPSRWDRITLGYRGRLVMSLEALVPLAHSAGEQPLPAERAVGLWQALKGLCPPCREGKEPVRSFARLDASLVDLSTEREGGYGRIRMTVGFRLPLTVDPGALREKVLATVKAELAGVDVEAECFGAEPACRSEKSSPLVRAFLPAIRVAGGRPRFVVKTGTSDMNVFSAARPGVPVLAYGPGDSALDHTPDEVLDLDEYHKSIQVLGEALRRLLQ